MQKIKFPHAPADEEEAKSPMSVALTKSNSYYWFLVLLLVILSAQGSFVNDMYTPALPAMCKFFGCSVSLSQMGLTMGMIGLAVGQMTLGPISDKYGRKPVLIVTTAIFVIAAIASTYSPTIHIFNGCRFLQGVGASSGYFLAKTIPADVYGGRQLAKLMALVGAINGIAPASAPVVGGLLADAYGWRSIFFFLAAFASLIIVLSLKMKESLPASRRVTGSLFSAFTNYKILFMNRPFMIHVLLKGTALGLLFSYISASPFILQTHYGLTQTQYGIIVGVNSLFLAAGSLLSLRFRPYKKAAFAGAVIATTGVAALAVSLYTIHNMWVYDICMVVILFASGMLFSTSNTLAMNEGRAYAGEAAAIIGLGGYFVGAIASPLVGIGNILHSTAIVNIVLASLVLLFAILSRRLPADLNG